MHTTWRSAPRPSAVFRHEGSTPGPAARSLRPVSRLDTRCVHARHAPSRSTALKYYRALESNTETGRRRPESRGHDSNALYANGHLGVNANDVTSAGRSTRSVAGPARGFEGFIPGRSPTLRSEGNEDPAPAVRRNRRDLMLALVVRRHPACWPIVADLGPFAMFTRRHCDVTCSRLTRLHYGGDIPVDPAGGHCYRGPI